MNWYGDSKASTLPNDMRAKLAIAGEEVARIMPDDGFFTLSYYAADGKVATVTNGDVSQVPSQLREYANYLERQGRRT